MKNKKYNILVTDDDRINLELFKIYLKNITPLSNIFLATNGKEAVEICENENIDLVFMNILMPIMDGYEATTLIKKMKPNLPVIMQSISIYKFVKDKVKASGADDFITMPVRQDIIENILKKYLKN